MVTRLRARASLINLLKLLQQLPPVRSQDVINSHMSAFFLLWSFNYVLIVLQNPPDAFHYPILSPAVTEMWYVSIWTLICTCCYADEKIALLGAIQSLFEGSMYTFVFLWTPALSPNDQMIPFGFIFATFMLASMLGSSLASRLMSRPNLRVESYMQVVFAVASGSLCLPVVIQVSHLTFKTVDGLFIDLKSFAIYFVQNSVCR